MTLPAGDGTAGRPEDAGSRASRWHALLFADLPVRLAVAQAGDALRPLSPAERVLIERAMPKRVSDFHLGRHCAHTALAALGISADALLQDAERAPSWPSGIAGSITHGDGVGAAAVARRDAIPGLGLDIERATGALPRDAWHLVFSTAECACLDALSVVDAERTAHVWFSVKESAFKAAYGAWGLRPPLRDIAVDPEDRDPSNSAPARDLVLRIGSDRTVRGRWFIEAGRVISRAVIEPV